MPLNTGGNAAPGQGGEAFQQTITLIEPQRNRTGNRMVGGLQVRCPAQNCALQYRTPAFQSDQSGLAFGERAGFVQRDGLELARRLQVNPAFDENTAPRGKASALTMVTGVRSPALATGNHKDNQG